MEEIPLELIDFEYGKPIQGLSYDQYAAQHGLRASHLHHIKRSPAHLRVELDSPSKETKSMREGKLIHLALENPTAFKQKMVIEPVFTGLTRDGRESTQSAAAKEAKKAWYASLPKSTLVVTPDELTMVTGVLTSVTQHRLVGNLIKEGTRETSVWVKDPETGLVLQCRPDFISSKGFVCDFKSCENASPKVFTNHIFAEWGLFYILSAAHYVHVMKLAGIGRPNAFTFIALEKQPPYGIMVYPMDEACLDVGERWRVKLTRLYAECMNKAHWPAYPERAVQVSPPLWAPVPEFEEDV